MCPTVLEMQVLLRGTKKLPADYILYESLSVNLNSTFIHKVLGPYDL